MADERRHQVFVYGTLKRGQRNAYFLDQAEFLGDHITSEEYWMYEFDDYPAVCTAGRHAIHGEIYRIDDTQFASLDELEWYPRFYQRIVIVTDSGEAWMYIVKPELCLGKRRLNGRWR